MKINRFNMHTLELPRRLMLLTTFRGGEEAEREREGERGLLQNGWQPSECTVHKNQF